MKTKSLVLLIVFLASIIPVTSVAAENPTQRIFDDSVALLHASRSILLNDEDLSGTSRAPGEMLIVNQSGQPDARDAALANLIQATKDQRNSLDASCRQLKNTLTESGKTCEQQVLESYCSTQRDKLNTRLGYLHKLRGDQRKLFTRIGHGIKRSAQNVWHAVGPVGRRLLRRVGPEVVEVVLSGGALSGGVLRKIVLKEARNIGKGELDRLLNSGVERFLVGQAALAQAIGGGDCTPGNIQAAQDQINNNDPEEQDQEEDDGIDYVASLETQGAIEESEANQSTVSFTGQISFKCNDFVGEGGDSQMLGKIPVVVNFDTGTYYGEAAFTHTRDDGQTITSTSVYQGIASQEGILHGTWAVTSCGWANKDVDCVGGGLNPSVGIISEDGSTLYLYYLVESSNDMLEVFQKSRDAIIGARAKYMNSSEYPPNCLR